MSREIKKEKKQVTKREKRGIGIPGTIVVLIACVMLIKGAMLQPQIIENQDKITELEAQKTYEEKRGEEIDNLKANADTDEYIEKIAREKLGMIRKDEIMFIDINGDE